MYILFPPSSSDAFSLQHSAAATAIMRWYHTRPWSIGRRKATLKVTVRRAKCCVKSLSDRQGDSSKLYCPNIPAADSDANTDLGGAWGDAHRVYHTYWRRLANYKTSNLAAECKRDWWPWQDRMARAKERICLFICWLCRKLVAFSTVRVRPPGDQFGHHLPSLRS